jgi:hypothetical protein
MNPKKQWKPILWTVLVPVLANEGLSVMDRDQVEG